MGLVERFDPPAFLPDFNSIPGQLEAWHSAVSNWFDSSIDLDRPLVPGGEFQFYNPGRFDPGGAALEQTITWNAFPKELLRRFGRRRALQEADTLWTIDRYYSDLEGVAVDRKKYPALFCTFFRPQNEYCEWHVVRDPNTNQILRVSFSSEPPEFWHALFGGAMPGDTNLFPGDQKLVLLRYRELVSPDVQLDDLIARDDINGPQGPFALRGQYNPYNKWNTTRGIVHLGAPPNSLIAEIQLGTDATVLRQDLGGRLLVEPEALICCAGYGGPDRNSDPTIGSSINALARLGAYVTLKNPVGIYMDHIDLSGWAAPDGKGVTDCVRIIRGTSAMIERLVVEVPEERNLTVSDLTIGGVPIRSGGHIAECITVKLVGVANLQKSAIANRPARCDSRCCIDPFHATSLRRAIKIDSELPPGTGPALVDAGRTEGTVKTQTVIGGLATSETLPKPASQLREKRRRRSSLDHGVRNIHAAEPVLTRLEEPVLPTTQIQGLIVPGFAKHHQTLIGVRIPAGEQVTRNFKKLLGELSGEIATAEQTLGDRRKHRRLRMAEKIRYPEHEPRVVLLAAAFSYPGLRKLTPGAEVIPSDAFREGLAARSALLGDPTEPTDEGNPAKWEVGQPGKELDALFIIAGDARVDVDAKARELSERLNAVGSNIVYSENGDVRHDLPGHEHFGFDDGVSQPGIRGRASDAADDFVTPRHISSSRVPESYLFGYPGQDLIWPGELLLGHPGSSPDPLIPGVPTPALPEWTRDGSFLVFRRLRQDVGLFWRTMRELAEKLGQTPGFVGMTDERLASRIVGRWQSGAPVSRVPDSDDQKLGDELRANNHFRFDSDAAELPLDPQFDDTFPMSKADPAGIGCPCAAHIRKVNTRDSGSDLGGRDSSYKRRILRVGIPFGQPLKDRYADQAHDPEEGKRGLLFLCVQSSIEEQFEFLTARWMGDPSRPKMPGGHDLLVGQNDAPGDNRVRRCVLFGEGLRQVTVETSARWIIPTGGGYFFVPSIRALREVLGSGT